MRQGAACIRDYVEYHIPTPKETDMIPANITNKSGSTNRNNLICWIKDEKVKDYFLEYAKTINIQAGWNFDIDIIEDLQYTVYTGGHEYGWHADQHQKPYPDGRMRKISFSLCLSNDYEGGEFDLEVRHPGADQRYESMKLKQNEILWFKSAYYHRVNPVTSGKRISLVGWVLGKNC